jgi:uncharacterized protein
MARLLIWLLLAGVVWWMWTARRRVRPPPPPARPAKPPAQLTTMQRCTHCGVHLPAPEALQDRDGRPYCSAAHRDLGPPPAR